MASTVFPHSAKYLTVSTGNTYNYVYIPTTEPARPTVLFLHGFPSSCYDWRHQIGFFAAHGYGVMAPDLLGYGGTSKPVSVEAYKATKMTGEIAELLNHENLQRVHAVAHDTGSILLSRLANYLADRLLSCTFLAVPYSKPGEHFDLEAVNAMTKQLLGKERFGYLRFFVEDHAGETIDNHAESFFSLFYPADPSLWTDHIGPNGMLESWLQADRQGEMASYITDDEKAAHQTIMQGHHRRALNWYRALVWNINEPDELEANLSVKLSCPVLMVFPAPMEGQFSVAGLQTNDIADDLTVKSVSTPGHWLQLEARDEVNSMLKEFFKR